MLQSNVEDVNPGGYKESSKLPQPVKSRLEGRKKLKEGEIKNEEKHGDASQKDVGQGFFSREATWQPQKRSIQARPQMLANCETVELKRNRRIQLGAKRATRPR